MTGTPDTAHVEASFGGPAIYRIVVRGALTADWSDRLAGMAINDATENDGNQLTMLEGLIRDPSELNAVLNQLGDLHMTIVKLEQVQAPA